MTGWRVTCLDDGNGTRVLATRRTFETRDAANAYAATVAPSRAARVIPSTGQPCYLWESGDAADQLRFYPSVAAARRAWEKSARELARYGQRHDGAVYFVDSEAEEWSDYPDRLFTLGPRGGARTERT